MLSSLPTW
uniref:Uncharacterized protein n=1 Tax=Arundo donax TaxID=35708 RepID=A0A0A9FM23_ARUDO